MNKLFTRFITIFMALFLLGTVSAQDTSFGFGTSETTNTESTETTTDANKETPAAVSTDVAIEVKIKGEVSGGVQQFFSSTLESPTLDFSKYATEGKADSKLSLEAKGPKVDAAINFKLNQNGIQDNPASILDSAYVRLFFGSAYLEGGLLKLNWGRGDSLRVLDVINPLDLSDLSSTDPEAQKIAQTMLHAVVPLGEKANLELVYLPYFEGNKIAQEGRWTPSQITDMKILVHNSLYYGSNPLANSGNGNGLYYGAYSAVYADAYTNVFAAAMAGDYVAYGVPANNSTAAAGFANTQATTAATAASSEIIYRVNTDIANRMTNMFVQPDTHSLEYSQGGIRLSGTLGAVDIGAQYYYGFIQNPVIDSALFTQLAANSYKVQIAYNRYHHAGLDTAFVLADFNCRLEAGANITDDLEGTKLNVYNPSLVWALGIDRDLFAGINLNIQGKGSYMLMHEKINLVGDIEKDTKETDSLVAARISQKLFKETVEWELNGAWGIEDMDFIVMPGINFTIGDAVLRVSGNYIFGNAEGQIGQFHDNSSVNIKLSYQF